MKSISNNIDYRCVNVSNKLIEISHIATLTDGKAKLDIK